MSTLQLRNSSGALKRLFLFFFKQECVLYGVKEADEHVEGAYLEREYLD